MSKAASSSPPPLRDGNRRWEAMPDLKNAELLDGIVYMPSPISRARDLGIKKQPYQRMQVREYLVALTDIRKLYSHQLTREGYRLLDPDPAAFIAQLAAQ
jgi:hypothetical protein